MSDKPTYTETLERNTEVIKNLTSHLEKLEQVEGRTSSGIIESQLDSVIRSVGELKADIAHNRRDARKRFDDMHECLVSIKTDCAATAQWKDDHESMDRERAKDIDKLENRINKLAAGNGVLAVVGTVIASLIGAKT